MVVGSAGYHRGNPIAPDVKVLLSSGYGEGRSTRVLDKGARGMLGKPYRMADLSQSLHRALRQD